METHCFTSISEQACESYLNFGNLNDTHAIWPTTYTIKINLNLVRWHTFRLVLHADVPPSHVPAPWGQCRYEYSIILAFQVFGQLNCCGKRLTDIIATVDHLYYNYIAEHLAFKMAVVHQFVFDLPDHLTLVFFLLINQFLQNNIPGGCPRRLEEFELVDLLVDSRHSRAKVHGFHIEKHFLAAKPAINPHFDSKIALSTQISIEEFSVTCCDEDSIIRPVLFV